MRPGSWVEAVREASVSQPGKPLFHRGRAVITKELGCGERNEKEKGRRRRSEALCPFFFLSVKPTSE